MRGIIFAVVILAVLIGIDFYVFQAIKLVSQNLSLVTKKFVYSSYWIFSVLGLIGVFTYLSGFQQQFSVGVRTFFAAVVMLNYFSKIFLLLFLLIDDVQRLIRWTVSKVSGLFLHTPIGKGEPISRSDFLVKAGVIVAALPFLSMIFGIFRGAHDYRIRRVKIKLKNLPESFHSIKIGQISDIHAGSFYSRSGVQKGVDMLMKEKADLVFFTGDLVNMVASEVNSFVDILSQIKAPMGVFSILGNHDYGDYVTGWTASEKKENMRQMINVHKQLGWDLMLNEHRILKRGGSEIALIGVENWGRGERWPKYGDLAKAYKGLENYPVKLLLSHDPSHWNAVVSKEYKDIDVTFSGHTHGFQFGILGSNIKWSPVQYVYEQWAGLYKRTEQFLYVNVGFGFIGFPGRVNMPPEITIFELERG
jgi:uncharacterized protein